MEIIIKKKSGIVGRPDRHIQLLYTFPNGNSLSAAVINEKTKKDITHKFTLRTIENHLDTLQWSYETS